MSVVTTDSIETLDVRYRALVDVAGVLASHHELQDLLHNLRTLIEPLIHFEFLAVFLRDDDAETITLRHKETNFVSESGRSSTYALNDSLPGMACMSQRSMYVPRDRKSTRL